MKTFTRGIKKFFVCNVAVIFTLILLPVFLVTNEVALFDQLMNYIFDDES